MSEIKFVLRDADKISESIGVSREVTITDKDYKDVLCYASAVGRRVDDVNESYFIEDREANDTHTLDALIALGVLEEKHTTFHTNERGLFDGYIYHVMYTNPSHTSLMPTSMKNVSFCCNTKHKVTYEVLFTDTDCGEVGYRYMVFDYETRGTHAMPFYNVIDNLDDNIQDWINEKSHGFKYSHEQEDTVLEFYDAYGQPYEVEATNSCQIMNRLSSIRIIECTTEIIEPTF